MKVKDFVITIRQNYPNWNGMCDSFEFLEFMTDHLEKATNKNILQIKQQVNYYMQCGHTGVISNKETTENFIYYE